jgi:hypothetical protein
MTGNLFLVMNLEVVITTRDERGFTSVDKGFDLFGCHASSLCGEERSLLLLAPVVDEVCIFGVSDAVLEGMDREGVREGTYIWIRASS